MLKTLPILLALFWIAAAAEPMPAAVVRDPPPDLAFPARMAVIHIPSGDVAINGVVYVAAGAGPHPTMLLLHGVPGNEKNLDLAQAVRRAGWNAVTFNYRGSWGSPGRYSFAQNLEDAKAALVFLRDPRHAADLQIDTARLVLAGHSMGGWITAETAAQDHDLLGAIMICAWDIGNFSDPKVTDRASLVAFMEDDHETLNSVTPEEMADEALAHRRDWTLPPLASGLVSTRLLVLNSDDGFTPWSTALVTAIGAKGGHLVQQRVTPTDHVWSDHRLSLAAQVITWLDALPR